MATIKGELGMIHSRDEFDSELKIFKRFLKEKGHYKWIMALLFPGGRYKRTKDDLFKTMLGSSYYNFPNILNYDATLGPAFKVKPQGWWDLHLRDIHYKWFDYWKKSHNVVN